MSFNLTVDFYDQKCREQGTLVQKKLGTLGNREHWVKHCREQGTLGKILPGTGNIGENVPGNREYGTSPITASRINEYSPSAITPNSLTIFPSHAPDTKSYSPYSRPTVDYLYGL